MSAIPEKPRESIPFYPDHVRTEAWVSFGVLTIIVLIGIAGLIWPVGIGDPANPMDTPAHTKPEWYFLFLYQVLKFVPKAVGSVMPVVGVILLVLWPFFDRRMEDTKKARLIRFIAVAVAMAVIIGLTVWGEVS